MTATTAQTVMQRKAGAGRPRMEGAALTPVRALGQALSLAAQELLGLPLTAVNVTASLMTLADLPEALEDRSLLAMIEGPADALGLIALAPPVFSGLIEMQTMGRIAAGEVTARKPTRTDAAMCADFIDNSLAAFEEQLVNTAEIVWAGGFRYASFLDDPRPLGLLLEDTAYRVFRITLGLGPEAQRGGGVLLALPARGRGRSPAPATGAKPTAGAASPEEAAAWAARLEQGVLGAQTVVHAVVARVTLPLAAVMNFASGTDIPIESTALESLRIEGLDGRLLARGRLGQAQGHRAVRLLLRPESGDVHRWEEGAAPAIVPPDARPSAAPAVAPDRGHARPTSPVTGDRPQHDHPRPGSAELADAAQSPSSADLQETEMAFGTPDMSHVAVG